MSSSIGRIFTLTTFGESHGEAIGGIIDGFPAGIAIDREAIRAEMARRRLDAQTPEATLCAAADYLICNDGSLADLELQCRSVLDSLRKEAHETNTTDDPKGN